MIRSSPACPKRELQETSEEDRKFVLDEEEMERHELDELALIAGKT